MSDENLLTSLAQAGFTDSEQKVLACLLQYESGSAGWLSKQTSLKRSTTYDALDSLISQGYVTKHKREKILSYHMAPKKLFLEVLESRARKNLQEVLNAKEQINTYLLTQINNQRHSLSGYKVEVADSEDGAFYMLRTTLKNEFSCIFNPQIAISSNQIKKLILEFLDTTSKNKTKIRDIVVAGKMTDWYLKKIINPLHQVRIIPTNINILDDFFITKDSVIFVHYRNSAQKALKVKHAGLQATLSSVFDLLWNSLK